MIAVVAKLRVREGSEAQFETVMLKLVAEVRANEAGNQLYTLVKDTDGQYSVLELYEDVAALEAHGKSEHFKAAGPGFAGVMSGPPDIQRFEVVEPS